MHRQARANNYKDKVMWATEVSICKQINGFGNMQVAERSIQGWKNSTWPNHKPKHQPAKKKTPDESSFKPSTLPSSPTSSTPFTTNSDLYVWKCCTYWHMGLGLSYLLTFIKFYNFFIWDEPTSLFLIPPWTFTHSSHSDIVPNLNISHRPQM